MARSMNVSQDYKGKLLKLIPSEIVGAYVAIEGFLKAPQGQETNENGSQRELHCDCIERRYHPGKPVSQNYDSQWHKSVHR